MTSEVLDLLKNLDLSEPKKLPPGKSGKPTKIATNSYRLTIAKGHAIFKYDVRIYETYVNKQGVASLKELCKQTKDDFTEQDRKAKTVFLLKLLTEKKLLPFGKLEEVVYDRAAILFSLKKYPAVNKLFDAATLKDMNYKCSEECTGVQFELKPVTEDYALITDDAFRDGDGNILEFLNLLTSQHAFVRTDKFIVYQSNRAFLFDPSEAGFREADCPALPDGKYLGIGCGKSVHIAEGASKGNVGPIVTVDVIKTAFHGENVGLHVKVAAILNCPVDKLESIYSPDKLVRIKDQLKGLTVQPSYLKTQRVIKIKQTGLSANKHELNIDGKKLTVTKYFLQKYNIQLKYPSYTVVDDRGSVYPIECLIVAPNQRVSGSQQSPDQMKTQIKACATLPAIRKQQTDRLMKSMELSPTSSNKHLAANSAKIESGPLMVDARVLPVPVVSNQSNRPIPVQDAKWSNNGFAKPAVVADWVVFLLLDERDSRTNPINEAKRFAKTLMDIGRQNGMQVGEPKEYLSVDRFKLTNAFEEAKKKAVKFILFLQSGTLQHHGEIKALEQKYQILTQDLQYKRTTETGRRDTMKNIVQKLNMKFGGLNHYVLDTGKIIKQRNLIIGVEFTHPPPTAPGQPPASPSVLGFSSNCSGDLQSFVGDYKFIQARAGDDRSAIDGPLKQLFKECLSRFKVSYGAIPETIWLYRNGASEGQFPVLLNKEIPLFYQAVHELTKGSYNPKLVYIAVSKDHVHRFYPENCQGGSATLQNVRPGTVIDNGIVSPSRSEFFLNAHLAFQGTAKAPKYTILRNGSDVNKPIYTMDQIQELTHALTFLHGIVSMAISLPAPLRVASESAKRGSSNYAQERIKPVHGNVDLEDIEVLNKEMVYSGRQLSKVRFNA